MQKKRVKFCTVCKLTKSVKLFGQCTARRDGLLSRCKECSNLKGREYGHKHRDKMTKSPMNGKVYCITNKINSKSYVGQTIHSLKLRMSKHESDVKHERYKSVLHRAIRKYGWCAFEITLIEDGFATHKELDDAEIFWLQYLQTIAPNGYNITAGGGGKSGLRFNHSKEAKLKISTAKKGHTFNVGKKTRNASSKYYGVAFAHHIKTPTWLCKFKYRTKDIHVGCFSTELGAAQAYNNYVVAHNLNRPLNKLT